MNSSLNIYKASAGSGKTFTLTIEYIYLMIRPGAEEEYLHTLAVTFTNKATAEMKDRIIQHLYGVWKGLASSQDYENKLLDKLAAAGDGMTAEQLRLRCGKALSQILHDYSRFRVETIDSFFQSILRTLSRELGQSPNMQVELRDQELLDIAVDRLIDGLDEDRKVREVVVKFVSEEMEENGKWNIKSSLKDFARCIFEEDFLSIAPEDREGVSDQIKVRQFRQRMMTIMQQTHEEIVLLAEKALKKMESHYVGEFFKASLPHINYLKNILEERHNFSIASIPGREKNKALEAGKGLANFISNPYSVLLKDYSMDKELQSMLRLDSGIFLEFMEKNKQLERRFNTAALARKYTNQLLLLSKIDELVRETYLERDTFPLSRTPILLSSLVDRQDSPFVFEKIGAMLRNVMIDEFQDTSRLQWDNFRVLLFENQALGGRDLLVGDIKQSIYRWRGGDWGLLQNMGENMKLWKPDIKSLDTNYRSEWQIVHFNNTLFTQAANILDIKDQESVIKIGGEAGIYADVCQNLPPAKADKKSGYCSLSLMKYEPRRSPTLKEVHEDVLCQMLKQIEELCAAGLPQEKIAILVRYNREAPLILDYFHEHAPTHIHISSDEAYLLSGSPLVTILVEAMRTLILDYDESPVSYRLLLMNYLTQVEHLDFKMDRIMRGKVMELLPHTLKEKRSQLRELPLYELVETLYTELQLYRISGQEAYHFAFLDVVCQHLKDNPNDIHSFLEMWDSTYRLQSIPSGKQEGIRILSIHKSKGLEFHTVMLPFCDWQMEDDRGETLWCKSEEEDSTFNSLGMMPISKMPVMERSFYGRRYSFEHLQSRIDEFNALYVGLTRASKNMFIWAATNGKRFCEGKPTVGNLIYESLTTKADETTENSIFVFGNEPITTTKANGKSDNRMNPDYQTLAIKMVSYNARLNFRQSNESLEMFLPTRSHVAQQSVGQSGHRALGVLYHNILAEIRDSSQTATVLQKAHIQGRLTVQQKEELSHLLLQMENNPTVAMWFRPDNRVFTESVILNPTESSHSHRTQRPDRIVMNGNDIMVVDYKFGEEHKGHKRQVSNYMTLLKKMYPQARVSGFVWYVRNKRVENV